MWSSLRKRPEKEDYEETRMMIPPPSTEKYQLMRRMIDDAEKYFNFGTKEIEHTLLKKLSEKINEYCG